MESLPSTSKINNTINYRENLFKYELYYLIAKFLLHKSFHNSFKVLVDEIEKNQLLPRRLDWTGVEHDQTFEEWDRQNGGVLENQLEVLLEQLIPNIEAFSSPGNAFLKARSLLGSPQNYSFLKKDSCLYTTIKKNSLFPPHGYTLLDSPCAKEIRNHVHCIRGRELAGYACKKHFLTDELYSQIKMFTRTIGHLSAVYCMLFDKSGRYIITGADDALVKIWSVRDGRLIVTLRGASAEISDLALDNENKLIAAGSCDKIIRVWNLQTLTPVAVLSGHSGIITAIQFCPSPGKDGVLISTGQDSCICFWTYRKKINEVKFDSKPLKLKEKVRLGRLQLVCPSFSCGGNFLAVGGADHYIRIYQIGGVNGVEKILETEVHTDRVDSMQWCHKGLRLASGSRDGTALIWHYENMEWHHRTLRMTKTLPGFSVREDIKKLQVTMVGWNCSDTFLVTASSDNFIRLWNSTTGRLVRMFSGHKDHAYVIEAHPFDVNLILTAGHDGHLFIWNIRTGKTVKSFHNAIEGQGYGAIFDAKWSPDGFSIAATDSHGHLMYFGIGSDEKYKILPQELFFHTDYRPLVRDLNHHVLDEQTQLAPHLMPPPFLVNMDGNPYPPAMQRLVPGRENCQIDQLVPNVIFNDDGNQEVNEFAGVHMGQLPDMPQQDPPVSAQESRPNLDQMIERLALEQDQRTASNRRLSIEQGASGSQSNTRRASTSGQGDHSYASVGNGDPLSPRANRGAGARRVGDVEGVRQLTGNWQRGSDVKWSRRTYVKPLHPSDLDNYLKVLKELSKLEMNIYEEENRKPPMPNDDRENQSDDENFSEKKQAHSYSTRSKRESKRDRNQAESEQEDNESNSGESEQSDGDSEIGTEPENDIDPTSESSSSDSDSTDYSDWTADAGVNLEPPKRTIHRQKKTPPKSKDGKKKIESDEEEKNESKGKGLKPSSSNDTVIRSRRSGKRVNMAETDEVIEEIPPEFRPPEWLSETVPKKAPYFPQMGDELIYFMQGHILYIQAVEERKIYVVDARFLPWKMRTTIREQEYVKIIGIKYEIKPPRLCCLKLGIMNAGTGRLTSESFTIKYHDMQDVLDFLILKQTYDAAIQRLWNPVESQEVHQTSFPDSVFMGYKIVWDNGERERLSPWDLETIDPSKNVPERGASISVTREESENFLYIPTSEEWLHRSRDEECIRIAHGIGIIMTLSAAEPFLAPVDLNAYPNYAMIIEYSVDLSTIKSRLENKFYRRISAVQWDVRYIATNAEKFNKKGDENCTDPTLWYHSVQAEMQTKYTPFLPLSTRSTQREGLRELQDKRDYGGRSFRTSAACPKVVDNRTWQQKCRDLLRLVYEREDSDPFRYPVDLNTYPDYNKFIEVSMDLTTVREELASGCYSSPSEFVRDMRLIFVNSKNYNTNKRSRIYSMTVRLEAFFEDQVKSLLASCRSSGKRASSHKAKPQRGLKNSQASASGQANPIIKQNSVAATRTRHGKAPPSTTVGASSSSNLIGGPISKKVSKRDESPGPTSHTQDKVFYSKSGRLVQPRHRTNYNALSPSNDETCNRSKRDRTRGDGTRRSKRVAELKKQQDDDDDSGEEYDPTGRSHSYSPKKKKRLKLYESEEVSEECSPKQSSSYSQKKKKTPSVDDNEEFSEYSLRQRSSSSSRKKKKQPRLDDTEEYNPRRSSSYSPKKKKKKRAVRSEHGSEDVGFCEQSKGLFNRRTSKRKLYRKSYSDNSYESEKEEIRRKSNRLIKKVIIPITNGHKSNSENEKIETKTSYNSKLNGKLCSTENESTDDSAQKKWIQRRSTRKAKTKSNIEESESESPIQKRKSGLRSYKEESEVEFDEDELEESEDTEEEKPVYQKNRKCSSVASSVRRARRSILEEDDLKEDRDLVVDENFIDDGDLSEEASTESDDSESDLPKSRRKKKKNKNNAISKQFSKKFKRKVTKNGKSKNKKVAMSLSGDRHYLKSNKRVFCDSVKIHKKKKRNRNKKNSVYRTKLGFHFSNVESEDDDDFQPSLPRGSRILSRHTLHRPSHSTKGSTLWNNSEDDTSHSSEIFSKCAESENSDERRVMRPRKKKRLIEGEDSADEEMNISSRGRIIRANIRMKDFFV